jgi:hypothetical protein
MTTPLNSLIKLLSPIKKHQSRLFSRNLLLNKGFIRQQKISRFKILSNRSIIPRNRFNSHSRHRSRLLRLIRGRIISLGVSILEDPLISTSSTAQAITPSRTSSVKSKRRSKPLAHQQNLTSQKNPKNLKY